VFVNIGVVDKQVVLLFSAKPDFSSPMPVDRWVLDPRECLDISEAMATAAFTAREELKPVGPALKAELVERHRMKLTQRLALVLNSTRENKKVSNGKLAQELVEIMLKEVFS